MSPVWHFIKSGAIPPYLPEAHAQNGVVIDVPAKAAERYAKGRYFVIVDGIVGPWFLPPFEALAVPLHYMVEQVLEPDEERRAQALLQRTRCRAEGPDGGHRCAGYPPGR